MFLLIDNYDSFTFNLVHYLGELGASTKVVRNDAITVEQALAQNYDGIIISPGPGEPKDAGITKDLIRATAGQIPVLGVCLGHQAIGELFGGTIIRAPKVMHGKISDISHNGTGLFHNLPSPFKATRYHSLIVAQDNFPDCLDVTATADEGVIMGLQHKSWPLHGVQFHPESIASEHGHALLSNFLDLAKSLAKTRQ